MIHTYTTTDNKKCLKLSVVISICCAEHYNSVIISTNGMHNDFGQCPQKVNGIIGHGQLSANRPQQPSSHVWSVSTTNTVNRCFHDTNSCTEQVVQRGILDVTGYFITNFLWSVPAREFGTLVSVWLSYKVTRTTCGWFLWLCMCSVLT